MPKSFPKAISFAEVVHGRDSTVRVTDDGMLFAVDLVVAMTGHNRNNSAKTLRRLDPVVFHEFEERYTSSRGGPPTKLINFENAIELIMVLPGKTANHIRKQFANIIVRYLDGETSLCSEIKENLAVGKVKSYSNFASKCMREIDVKNAKQAQEMPQTCYVYATKSPAFPGLIKIGKTYDVSQRMSQLNTSCAPMPHVIVAVAPTFDNTRDEATAHTFFANARQQGEFFKLDDEDVIAYFASHITAQYNTELAQNIFRLQGKSVFSSH